MKDKDSGKVIAVVVTYNRKELLKECVDALLSQDYENCYVLIVDNASTDGTSEFIREERENPRVYYRNTGSNLGGAGGFNFGIREAYNIGCDFICVMDDDCIVHKDTLTAFMNADRQLKGQYGFLSSKVLWKDGSLCRMNIQKNTLVKKLSDPDLNWQRIVLATFVSLFLKASVVKEVGLPYKEFVIWTDDWEYTRRISRKYPCYYISKSVVTHKSATNTGSAIEKADTDRLYRFRYMYRNETVLFRGEGPVGRALFGVRLAMHKARILKSDLPAKDKKERLKLIDEAVKTGRTFYPQIEYVTDGQISSEGNGCTPGDEPNIVADGVRDGGVHKKRDILEVNVDDNGCGGVFSLVRSVILNKPEGYHMDIACIMPFSDEKNVKELNDAGCQIYFIGIEGQHHVSMADLEKNLYALLMKHSYEYVHIHSDRAYRMAAFGRAAKRAGVPHIIFHSHATDVDGNYRTVKKLLHLRYRGQLKTLGTRFVACSRLAAEWMYPGIPENQVTIVNNGIDLEKFRFNPGVREEERNRLGLSDALVVGTVGRFSYQKNQEYMIDIMSDLVKKKPEAKLLLVGSHEGTEDIWNMVKEKTAAAGLSDHVIFYGTSPHVERLMQAMDVLILPSHFEGLPVVGVEAQAAGLPCIFSDRITRETKLTDDAEFIGIGPKDVGKWADEICRMAKLPRKDMSEKLKEEKFDLSDTIEAFLNLYK